MINGNQLLAHLIGDYFLQSDWAATNKTKNWYALLSHIVLYTLVFYVFMILGLLPKSFLALLVIGVTHGVIDRWSLAKYICWAKNFLAPQRKQLTIKRNTNGISKRSSICVDYLVVYYC